MCRVAILKEFNRKNLKDSVKRLVQSIGGVEAVLRPSDSVLVKPNVLCGLTAETGATVCPEVIEGIVEMCLEAGASKIIVGEASNWGIDTMEAFHVCGYDMLSKRYGIQLLDLKKDRQVQVAIEDPVHPAIELPRTIFEVNVVVDVPVLKTHNQTVLSASLKNLAVGTCSDKMKKSHMHSICLTPPPSREQRARGSELDHMIASVSKVLPCHLVVVDGFYGMQGHGSPIKGEPANAGILVAGRDRVAVDSICARLIGIDPELVPHIRLSAEQGIGTLRLDDIKLIGESIESAGVKFKESIIRNIEALAPANVKILNENACYSCISNLGYFLVEHGAQLEDLGPVTFVLGKATAANVARHSGRIVYYGNCAGAEMYGGGFVPGCVPRSRRQVFEALGIGDRYESYEG